MKALLDLIRGEGEFAFLGNGLHTYPDTDFASQALHNDLVELERRGMVKRQIDEPRHIYWVAV